MVDLAGDWLSAFYSSVERDRSRADSLRDASSEARLGDWTRDLTSVAVEALEALSLACAAKGHRCTSLPVSRNEYLALDVTGFAGERSGWRLPSVACELENSRKDDLVAYSLWKLLCVQVRLRVLICYRRDREKAPALVSQLARDVVTPLRLEDRLSVSGETLVVVGSRNESSTFPYGFFRTWKLNSNTGEFAAFSRG